MNRTYYRIHIILLLLIFPVIISAQDSLFTLKSYDRLKQENPWMLSDNSAGYIFSSFIPDGVFSLNTDQKKGDLKLSQISPEEREYSFKAIKTIRLEKIVFDGGVSYLNQQQENVGWTARMNPSTDNPYMLADSIYGLYSKDYVSIFGSFGYQIIPKMSVGIKVDYLVGNGARIKDPRPENDLFSLNIYPSLVLNLSFIKLGANLHLRSGREEISYTTIENSTTYRFFRLLGLGKGAKTVNTWSYYRNHYNSGLGGDIQAEYKFGKFDVFNSFSYFSNREAGEDGSSNPRKDAVGDFITNDFRFFTIVKTEKKLIHLAKVYADLRIGEGLEFIQEPYMEDGITYYRTIAEVNKYSMKHLNPGLTYSIIKPYNKYINKWNIEAGIQLDHMYSKYLLEAEKTITNLSPSLNLNYSIFQNKNQWSAGVYGNYSYNLNNEIKQIRAFSAIQEIASWENITYPDHLILSSNTMSIGTSVRYGREVKILKDKSSQVFVDLSSRYMSASNEAWAKNKTMRFYSIKIGITY